MYRITYWLLYAHQCYSLFLGILRFRYDFINNKAYTTSFITYYSVVVNVLTLTTLPWIYYTALRTLLQHERVGLLVLYMFIATKTLRVLAVALAIVYNWHRRCEVQAVIRDFNHLRWHYFARYAVPVEWQRRFELKIIKNVLAGVLVDVSGLVTVFYAYENQMSASFIISNVLFFFISNILYLIMNQYYFAVQTVILFGNMLNRQLNDIMKSAEVVAAFQYHRRLRTQLKARCLILSRELDELALVHQELQRLALTINDILKWQGVGVLINMFIFNISLIYTVCSMLWAGEFTISQSDWVGVLMGISYVVYIVDVWDFVGAILEHINVFQRTSVNLALHTSLPLMDTEFERSIEKFQLQLSINQYRLSMLGLFDFNSECAFSMFASVVVNSVLMIQFDYQYFQ